MSLHHEPLELSSAISQAMESVAPLIKQRQLTLELDMPDSGLGVLGDEDRLRQVVANLLTNAAKYTPPGGHIQVRAHPHDEGIALVVADNGSGLPPEIIPRIFEPFVQGPRTLDRSEGGLGLALVRSLVEAHGGWVEPHSDGPGRGSTFTVWLPKHARTEAPPPGTSPGSVLDWRPCPRAPPACCSSTTTWTPPRRWRTC
jgi:signal transduction histidine kinase